MPKVTVAHTEARRDQIIEAACKCFSKKGFRQTTIRDICDEAGLSTGAVYGYFEGKEEITRALAALGRRNTRAMLEAVPVEADAAPVSLSRLVQAAVDFIDSKKARESTRLDVALWGEAVHTPLIRELLLEAMADTAEPFTAIVERGQHRGEISSRLESASVARVLLALIMGLVVQKTMDPAVELDSCKPVIASLLQGSFVAERSER